MAAVPEADLAGPLFEQYERGLYRFCLSRLRSKEDAEDAVQATFVRAVRALQCGVRPDVAPAWLFTIARNVCSSRRLAGLRRARVETTCDLDTVRASALAVDDEQPEELIGLRAALEEMPPQLRRVVLMREWRGLSYHEISAELGVSQSAVETLLFRARRDLAKRLRGLLDLSPLLWLKTLLGGAAVVAVAVATVDSPRVERSSASPLLRARGAAQVVVPHATTLPLVTPRAHRRHVPPVVRVKRLPPPVIVHRVYAPVAASRPVIVRRHEALAVEVARKPASAQPPSEPTTAPSPATPATQHVEAPPPAAPPPAPKPASTAQVVAPPAPAVVSQTVDTVQSTAETTAAAVTAPAATALPSILPAPAPPSLPDPTSLLPGG